MILKLLTIKNLIKFNLSHLINFNKLKIIYIYKYKNIKKRNIYIYNLFILKSII